MPETTFTPEQEQTLERIEADLDRLNDVLRILVWSKTGEWMDDKVEVCRP